MARPEPRQNPLWPNEPDCATTLSAISCMTQAKSAEHVRRRLVEGLSDLLPISSVRFLTPAGADYLNQPLAGEIEYQGREASIRWDLMPRRGIKAQGSLRQAISSQRPQSATQDAHSDVFPIMFSRELLELIEIRRALHAPAASPLLPQLIEIYQNFLAILHAQERDALTGVLNRGAFDAHLALTAQNLKTPGQSLKLGIQNWWLMMLDVDHFKQVNDVYGHLIGDEVLLLVAREIQASLRRTDRVYRYGGEEFAVLLSPCQHADARRLADNIRECIAGAHFPQVESVTLSIGLAAVDQYDHVANIVGRADRALYQAKRNGRNRVEEFHCLAQSPLRAGLQTPGTLEIF